MTTIATFRAGTPNELGALAPSILQAIGQQRIVLLDAPMGAGKTTLVTALLRALGSQSIVNSPTFAIVNDYELPTGDSVYHFDLYRLRNAAELLDMGCEEYFASGCYCFVEWPELAQPLLPDDVCIIKIEVGDDDVRTIEVRR